MKRGSLFPELHSYIRNFFWLMWKQIPHQSFSPGPIICKHQMKPYIAMQILVPRGLQYNHPVTKKVERRRNYHTEPHDIHKRMLRGPCGRFYHHCKDMLAFPWKCALLYRVMLAPTCRNLNFICFYSGDGLGWIIHTLSSVLQNRQPGIGIVLEGELHWTNRLKYENMESEREQYSSRRKRVSEGIETGRHAWGKAHSTRTNMWDGTFPPHRDLNLGTYHPMELRA